MRKLSVILFLLFAFAGLSHATDRFVSNLGIDAVGRGGPNTPLKTITYALASAETFDTIKLYPGVYSSAEGEVFPLAITKILTLEGLGSAESVIIRDSYGINTAIIGLQNKSIVLKNFTIEWVGNYPNSVAVRAEGSNVYATLDSLRLDGKTLGSYGIMTGSNAIFRCYRCQVFNTSSAGMFFVDQSSFEVVNCVIALGLGSGIELRQQANGTIKNSIFYFNSYGLNAGLDYTGTVANTYNDVFFNTLGNYVNVISGEGSISLEPNFVNIAVPDFHLQSWTAGDDNHSDCIDAGDPADSYSNEPPPNGERINMGAYGNTASAEFSWVGARNYYVSSTIGNNVYTGTNISCPWKTITYALTRVTTGCAVYVAAGLYNQTGNGETFPLTINYPITLSGEGFATTTIEGNPLFGLSVIDTAPMGRTTIEGFYLTPTVNFNVSQLVGISSSVAGANQSTDIRKNYFNGKSRAQTNCLIASASSHTDLRTHNIANNIFTNASSGTLAGNNETEILKNNTYYNCTTASQLGSPSSIEAKNNIIMACTSGFTCPAGSTVNCRYNAGYINGGTYGGGVTIDGTDYDGVNPRFVSTSEGNFYLMSQRNDPSFPFNSPFIDLGDPADDWSLEPIPNGGRINMGAFGGTATAELSYSGTTTTTTTSTTTTTGTTVTTVTTTSTTISTTTGTSTTTTTETTTTTRAILLPGGQIVVYPVVWNRTNLLKIAYKLTADQATRLVIFSSSGTIVFNNQYIAGGNGGKTGYNEILWDGKTPSGNYVGNGVYVVQLIAGSERIAKGYITVLQ